MRINPYKLFTGCFTPTWILVRTEITSIAKHVYGRLSQYAGENGYCYPKQETLARDLGSSIATIKRAVKELAEHKLIEIDQRGLTKSNEYYFLLHDWMGLNEESLGINMTLQEGRNLIRHESSNLIRQDSKDLILPSIRESNKIFNEEDIEYKLSECLYKLILHNDPKYREPDFQKWAKHIDAMIRLDKRDPNEIQAIINFSQQDEFWKTNILSTDKLRKQYTKLLLKAKGQNGKRQTITNETVNRIANAASGISHDERNHGDRP